MVKENPDRNLRIYDLWKKGYTIKEITFETGIPRSTVGYYVRKFNKRAKSGEPIVIHRVETKQDEKSMTIQAYIKTSALYDLNKMIKDGEIDKAYKLLWILKLWKELHREFLVTEEERQASLKNMGYLIKQILIARKLGSS